MEANDYCSYELSLALKNAGCDLYADAVYLHRDRSLNAFSIAHVCRWGNEEYHHAIPLWQAQKWLREKKHLIVLVDYILITKDTANRWFFSVSDTYGLCDTDKDHKRYNSYEAALSAGIEAALELRGNKISKEPGHEGNGY